MHVLARLRERLGVELHAFHVHHGLSPNANAWAAHVSAQAAALGIPCEVRQVQVEHRARTSLEAQARDARYAALDALCEQHGVAVLALAHHADDQAETVLLQLARGAGLPGLAAMPRWIDAPAAARWRPLLDIDAQAIDDYAQAAGVVFIDDESNAQLHYRRNAIRHEVLSALRVHVPHVVGAIGRSARHVQSALALMREVGEGDLERVRAGAGVSISALAAMSAHRRINALRVWIEGMDVPAPSDARLTEIWRQVSNADVAAQPVVEHAGSRFMRHRDVLACVAGPLMDTGEAALGAWDGREAWRPSGWAGEFRFERATIGLAEGDLRSGVLAARPRCGGERLRLAHNRPARSLKHWYQTLGVALWQREQAPLLWLGDALVYVPFVGMDADRIGEDGPRWAVTWHPD